MGKQWKQWGTLFWGAPKSLQMVSAAMKLKDACSLEGKLMTNLKSLLKSRDITFPTKVHLVKTMVFPVVMYGFESWTIKKAELWRIDAFELWCWRLLRVPWTVSRSKQSIIKEINPEYSLEGLMLKLKLQFFGHLMWRTDSLEKTLMLGKTEGGRRRGKQRIRWLDGITDEMKWLWVSSGSWWWTRKPGVLQSMVSQRVGHDWVTELTKELTKDIIMFSGTKGSLSGSSEQDCHLEYTALKSLVQTRTKSWVSEKTGKESTIKKTPLRRQSPKVLRLWRHQSTG